MNTRFETVKRYIDLARTIPFTIEKDEEATGHGFAVGLSSLHNYQWESKRLTWQGHEFLDSVRNDNLWGKAKEKLEKIEIFSFQVLQNVPITLATQQ